MLLAGAADQPAAEGGEAEASEGPSEIPLASANRCWEQSLRCTSPPAASAPAWVPPGRSGARFYNASPTRSPRRARQPPVRCSRSRSRSRSRSPAPRPAAVHRRVAPRCLDGGPEHRSRRAAGGPQPPAAPDGGPGAPCPRCPSQPARGGRGPARAPASPRHNPPPPAPQPSAGGGAEPPAAVSPPREPRAEAAPPAGGTWRVAARGGLSEPAWAAPPPEAPPRQQAAPPPPAGWVSMPSVVHGAPRALDPPEPEPPPPWPPPLPAEERCVGVAQRAQAPRAPSPPPTPIQWPSAEAGDSPPPLPCKAPPEDPPSRRALSPPPPPRITPPPTPPPSPTQRSQPPPPSPSPEPASSPPPSAAKRWGDSTPDGSPPRVHLVRSAGAAALPHRAPDSPEAGCGSCALRTPSVAMSSAASLWEHIGHAVPLPASPRVPLLALLEGPQRAQQWRTLAQWAGQSRGGGSRAPRLSPARPQQRRPPGVCDGTTEVSDTADGASGLWAGDPPAVVNLGTPVGGKARDRRASARSALERVAELGGVAACRAAPHLTDHCAEFVTRV
eukprot:TRINITY_DN14327_c0_g1_i1.p1 TRINITY_DN14327_c0_g1~~TRINITY_DN14327_c0_g1_i1.p1  ORF type:complete len:609 (+),score=55.36 TRINITY_DN14327_c0_g1_i1:158-1828(+)